MSHVNRPTQITTILETISSEKGKKISAELEMYIADLEAKQPDRPSGIAEILKSIGTQFSTEFADSLETYIAGLEAGQQPLQPGIDHHDLWDPENPPIWSHERTMQREHRSKERALQKLNDYR